jgi:DNA-binding winged helix-turn-helix (wHTH) protein
VGFAAISSPDAGFVVFIFGKQHSLCEIESNLAPQARCPHVGRAAAAMAHRAHHLGSVRLMSSIEGWAQTNTPEPSRYLSVDPHTLGRLRVLRVGDVELQLDGHRLLVRGKPVHLAHKEFVILRHLMDNAGRVVTRRALLENAWGLDRAGARNYLEVHICRLRTKIESDVDRPTRIRTVRGVGYIFDLPQDDSIRDAVAGPSTGVPSPHSPQAVM